VAEKREKEKTAPRFRYGLQLEVIKLLLFDSKVASFVTACKLYMRMRMREKQVKEQVW